MQVVRRRAILTPSSSSERTSKVDSLADVQQANRPAAPGSIVAMRPVDPLDDSLEHIWPGIAAETAARRAAGISAFSGPDGLPGPYRHSQSILDAIAEAEAEAKRGRRRTKAVADDDAPPAPKKPRKPRVRKTAAPDVASELVAPPCPEPVADPVREPEVPVPDPVRRPAARAVLGQRRAPQTELPLEAKRIVEGARIPSEIVGIVRLTGTMSASTGKALIIDVEGQNNVARGIVVWAGPLQDRVRAAAGNVVRLGVRQPSNPRFSPAACAIAAA